MHFYLVRHAHALSEAEDPERPLSGKGRDAARRVAEGVRRAGIEPAEIWHSPLVRARETAEIFAQRLGFADPLRTVDGLLPDDAPEGAAERLRRQSRSVMVVGHEPHLSGLAGILAGSGGVQPAIDFKKGAVLCLEPIDARRPCRILWLITPDLAPET